MPATLKRDGVAPAVDDPPGERFYEQFGFQASAPTSDGMYRRLSDATGESA